MSLKNTLQTYGSVAKFFHWTIFLLIAALLTIGFLMTGMPMGPDKFKIYGLHKSVGITLLLLVLLRLIWKLANITPLLPNSLTPLEKLAARSVHALLYVAIIAMPLSGWLMSSASGFSVSVFGWFTLPDLIGPDKALAGQLRDLHGWLGFVVIVLVLAHAGAALLHHFYYKDNILRRMLPFSKGGNSAQDDSMAGC
jgi:cytochrome b561